MEKKLMIKENRAFQSLIESTNKSRWELDNQIITNLTKLGFLTDPECESGKSIENIIREFEEFTLQEVAAAIFDNDKCTMQDLALIKNITFWGVCDGEGCSDCGFEVDENNHCYNSECGNFWQLNIK